jgi:serine/threonine protein kinase
LGQASSQYELVARLAEGGMAEIFLARSRGMAGFARYVVLKRILPERGTDPRWIEMFLDEARLAAQLQHPNVAQVFDLGRLGEGYFFTMEYVHGANMREVLVRCAQRGQRLSLAVALGVAVGAASGLDHAHERRDSEGQSLGIVHRDVSPSNLMLSYDGVVKLVDFGVAKAHLRSSVTQSGTVKGKISYLSPEQCRGREVDRRSDIFALGIVLYEMATTKRLYRRNSDFETMTAIVNEDPEPPSRYNPEVSPQFDATILRALAKHPEERQQSAAELLEELEEVARLGGFSISNSNLRRQMKELYGEPLEPWRALEPGGAGEAEPPRRETEVTYTADGLLEEDIDSVEVPVPKELTTPPRPTAQIRRAVPAEPREARQEAPPLAGPLTSAFPVEVDASQVPLLDSLRAAVAATTELEHDQSTVRPGSEPAGATEISPPVSAAILTQRQAQLPMSGPHASTILASPMTDSGPITDSGPGTEAGTEAGRPTPGRAGQVLTTNLSAIPRVVSEGGSGRYVRPASEQGRPDTSPPRSMSEAITVPVVGKDPAGPLHASEVRPRAPTPLPALLASGQVSVGPVGPSSGNSAPNIWDRPMPPPTTNPGAGVPPTHASGGSSGQPQSPPRPAHGTPSYTPKATLLGSAPPPRQRSDSHPPPMGDPGTAGPRLPGMPPAHASQPPMPQMQGHASQPPMRAHPSQPQMQQLRPPAGQPHSNYGSAMQMPAYPRAPQSQASSVSNRILQEQEGPRRVVSATAVLIALVCIGIALGAYVAIGGDDAPSTPATTPPTGAETPTTRATSDTPAVVPADAAPAPIAPVIMPPATPDAAAAAAVDAGVPAVPAVPDAAAAVPVPPPRVEPPPPSSNGAGAGKRVRPPAKKPTPETPASTTAPPPARSSCVGPLCRR